MSESMVPGIYDPNALDLKEVVDDGEAFERRVLLLVTLTLELLNDPETDPWSLLDEARVDADRLGSPVLSARVIGARLHVRSDLSSRVGQVDAYDLDAISRLEISQDNTLTELQKQQALGALDVARSAELRDAHDAPMAVVRLEETTAQLRQNGASDDDVYRARAAAFDPQAAARLAEVDRDEAAWKVRIQTYLAERDRLGRANVREPEQVRLAALAALRTSQFTVDAFRYCFSVFGNPSPSQSPEWGCLLGW